ncbi:LysR family transcriptional regulator [Shewanella sp. UCD-FRSSP16_17]|uniref:LysR family transcriptional regulator n=1 Tax=Shewanella sp. UCD-FRSSP16_17 TaxID=1853256 RepID=UPI0007EEA10A|nr:LysR family transcriptional regulator [Shewanella sp. UCD-FRSSP16_17]OBT11646.1 LysR family transcriptional regulator [Shewanella sp. UCD-FRSSP16_17]
MSRAKSTLEQWRIIQSVVDYGGYAQAAEKLNKSQSSLNHAVAKLQSQLGIQLLEVKGRKAYLTEQGEVLLRRSRHLTQTVDDLELLASNLGQGWEPNLTIARELIYPMHYLVGALQAFLPHSRGTRVTIIDSVISGTHELITQQQADIAICGVPPKGFIAESICESEMILVCAPEHALAQQSVINDDQELAQHLQIVIKDTAKEKTIETGWLKSEQRWTVTNFHEAITILKNGLGFCWLPAYLVSEDIANKSLHRLSLIGSTSRKIQLSLVVPNRDRQGPASQLLESLILHQHGLTRL